jgi:hypothetical protein
MNVIELAALLAVIGLNIWLAKVVSHGMGISFWVILLFFALATVTALRWILLAARKKRYPNCANARCSADDYQCIDMTPAGLNLVCKCGQRYLFNKDRFQKVATDGTVTKFKKRRFWGQWVDELE